MLQQAVDDAGAVEPGHDREPPRHGGRLEAADLLHPPDIQLQVRAADSQRVQAAFSAPGQVAAQVGLGVVAGGALETGQVGGHREPQLISERDQVIGRDRWQVGEVRHAQTLRLLPPAGEPCERAGRGRTVTFTSRSSSINAPSPQGRGRLTGVPAGHQAWAWGTMGGC